MTLDHTSVFWTYLPAEDKTQGTGWCRCDVRFLPPWVGEQGSVASEKKRPPFTALSCFAGVEKNSSRNLSMGELFISYNVQLFMFEQHRRSVIPLKVPSSVIKIWLDGSLFLATPWIDCNSISSWSKHNFVHVIIWPSSLFLPFFIFIPFCLLAVFLISPRKSFKLTNIIINGLNWWFIDLL